MGSYRVSDKQLGRGLGTVKNKEQLMSGALSELSRITTLYHEAAPDRVESARQEYTEALRKFNAVWNYGK